MVKQRPHPTLPPFLPLAASAWALAPSAASAALAGNSDGDDEAVLTYHHYTDAALAAVTAWCVFAVTLEVNDFRHRLKESYETSSSESNRSSHRYVASLVAIRYGLRDAVIDWTVVHSLLYGIVAGITWTNVNPNSLYVIWGFSRIFSAAILAYTALKLPQWLGVHDRSQINVLKDTSGLAPTAVEELTTEGSAITSFRYQVRLGVGKHLSQFVWFLLPFYVNLKPWAYLLSIVVGVVFGHAFLFVVFVCRVRFRRHRLWVAAAAAIVMAIISALVFTAGMYVVELGWNRNYGYDALVFALSFFIWLACCLLLQGARYYRQLKSHEVAGRATLFEEDEIIGGAANLEESEAGLEEGAVSEEGIAEEGEGAASGLGEPLLDGITDKREHMDKKKSSYLYQTVYFDHATMLKGTKHETAAMSESMASGDSGMDDAGSIFRTFAAIETGDRKLYQCLWESLPFQPAWRLFAMGTKDTFSCRSEENKSKPMMHRVLFVLLKILKICLNSLCLYVVIVELGATAQRNVTVAKLPVPQEKLYTNMNDSEVCAFDTKCGSIEKFASQEDALDSGYTVAHCGPCGYCSNWNDMERQPLDLATLARTCGQRNLFNGVPAIQQCIEKDIGFTPNCAYHWARSVSCSRKFCAFIYLQSVMINQVGNFKVTPSSITSATCSEASCEAGNPGAFVLNVGANRRRMNIKSEIERPKDQQCTIVGIPRDAQGYNDWKKFMDPMC